MAPISHFILFCCARNSQHDVEKKHAIYWNDCFYEMFCILPWLGSHLRVTFEYMNFLNVGYYIPLIKFLVQGIRGTAAYIWLRCCLSAACSISQVKLSSFAHHACFPGTHTHTHTFSYRWATTGATIDVRKTYCCFLVFCFYCFGTNRGKTDV